MWACFVSVTFQISKKTEICNVFLLYNINAHFHSFFILIKSKTQSFKTRLSILQSCKEINAQMFFTVEFLNCIPMFLPSYLSSSLIVLFPLFHISFYVTMSPAIPTAKSPPSTKLAPANKASLSKAKANPKKMHDRKLWSHHHWCA